MTDVNRSPKTIVLVTNQFECERIIRCGKKIADATGTSLVVFSVQSGQYPNTPSALEYLFKISKQHDAPMDVTYSKEPLKKIVEFIRHNKTRNVLTGVPQNAESILLSVWKKFPRVRFFTVNAVGNPVEVANREWSIRILSSTQSVK